MAEFRLVRYRLFLLGIILGVILGGSVLRSGLTGLVVSESLISLPLDVTFTEDSAYDLAISGPISSLSISGSIIGQGDVYLLSGDQEFLVFSTSGQESNEPEVVALAIADLPDSSNSEESFDIPNIDESTIEPREPSVPENMQEPSKEPSMEPALSVPESTQVVSEPLEIPSEVVPPPEVIPTSTENPEETINPEPADPQQNPILVSEPGIEVPLEFRAVCRDSCALSLSGGEYSLRVHLGPSSVLYLNEVLYTEVLVNDPPVWSNLTNITVTGNLTMNLSSYALDPEHDNLTFLATQPMETYVDVFRDRLLIRYLGSDSRVDEITLFASDAEYTVQITVPIFLNEYEGIAIATENLSVTSNESNDGVKLLSAVKLHKPVHWKKTIHTRNETIEIALPISATNISASKRSVGLKQAIENKHILVLSNDSWYSIDAKPALKELTDLQVQLASASKQDKKNLQNEIRELKNDLRNMQRDMVRERRLDMLPDELPILIQNVTSGMNLSNESLGNISIEINFTTKGPESVERNLSLEKKEVVIFSDIRYENIVAHTSLPRETNEQVGVYWILNEQEYREFTGQFEGEVMIETPDGFDTVELDNGFYRLKLQDITYTDSNSNGIIDTVEWIVPHLSNQTYEVIIEITQAAHLNSNRTFIQDIYGYVFAQDGNWSPIIHDGEYVRITFERNLTKTNDITLVARSNATASITVFAEDQSAEFAEFESITAPGTYKMFLEGMPSTESHAVFDLRVNGTVELDYIIDPSIPLGNYTPLGNTTINKAMVAWISDDNSPNNYSTGRYMPRFAVTNTSGSTWIDNFVTKNLSKYSEEANLNSPSLALNPWGWGIITGKRGDANTYGYQWDYNGSSGKWVDYDDGTSFALSSSSLAVDMYNNNSIMVGPSTATEGLFASISTDKGATWSAFSEITNPTAFDAENGDTAPAVTYLGDGTALAVVREDDTDQDSYLYFYYNGAAWNESGRITLSHPGTGIAGFPTLAAYDVGKAWLIWSNYTASGDPVYVREWNRGWGTITALDTVGNICSSNGPTIGCGSNGTCMAVWEDSLYNLEYSYYDGTSWSGAGVDVGSSADVNSRAMYSVAVDSWGNALLCYVDDDDVDLYTIPFTYATKSWGTPTKVSEDVNINSALSEFTGCDIALFPGSFNPVLPTNTVPTLTSISVNDSAPAPGSAVTITAISPGDTDGDILQMLCCKGTTNSCTPNMSKTICTSGNFADRPSPYSATCSFSASSSEGTEYVRCSMWDLQNKSTVRNVSYLVDSIAPKLVIGQNLSLVEYGRSIRLNWTASDVSLSVTKFNITWPNGSLFISRTSSSGSLNLSTINNITILGTYTMNIWANDSVSHVNTSSAVFTVNDTISPAISYSGITPSNGTTHNQDWVYTNVSVNDASAVYGFTNLDNSLIGWYSMDNDASAGENTTRIFDWSGMGNNLTVQGNPTLLTSGRFGGAYDFDGTEDYLEGITGETMDMTGTITIAGWFRLDSVGRYYFPLVRNGKSLASDLNEDGTVDAMDQGILAKYFGHTFPAPYPRMEMDNSGSVGPGDFGFFSGQFGLSSSLWQVQIVNSSLTTTSRSGRRLHFSIAGPTTKEVYSTKTFGAADLSKWYHFAAVYNGTMIMLYINGTLDNLNVSSGAILPTNGSNFTIGATHYYISETVREYDFNGAIDEVVVLNRSLTADEIGALYDASEGRFQANISGLSSTIHTFRSYAVDAAGNRNQTEEWEVTLDASLPLVLLGKNLSWVEYERSLRINWSATDAALSVVNFNVTYPNNSLLLSRTSASGDLNLSTLTNITAFGAYTMNIWANDTAGNINTASTTFTVNDTLGPHIDYTGLTPSNASTRSRNHIEVNVTATDASRMYGLTNFDNSLVGWWRFDNKASAGENATRIYDWSGNGRNGSVVGTVTAGSTGKFGNAFSFSGLTNSYVNIASNSSTSSAISVSGWVFARNITSYRTVYTLGTQSNTVGYHWFYLLNGDVWWQWTNGTAAQSTSFNTNLGKDRWYLISLAHNYTNKSVKLYINGALNETKSIQTSIAVDRKTSKIGAYSTTNFLWNGTIDELIIMNRTLSAFEVQALYDASAGRFRNNYSSLDEGVHTFQSFIVDEGANMNQTALREVTIDTVAPNLELVSPSNDSRWYTASMLFNWTLVDSVEAMQTCNLTIDGVVNASNIAATNDSWRNFSVSGFLTGTHTWKVSCWDAAGNVNTSSQWSFTTSEPDVTAPKIELNSPLSSKILIRNVTFNWSVTDDFSSPLTCNLTLNGSRNATNLEVTNASWRNMTINLLARGTWHWNVSCWDVMNHTNTSVTRTFTINTPPPIVTLFSPSAGFVAGDTTPFLNWSSVVDSDGDSVNYTLLLSTSASFAWYNFSRNNITTHNYTILAPLADNMTYFWKVLANDTINYSSSAVRNFSIDTEQAISISLSDALGSGITWSIASIPVVNASALGNNGTAPTGYDVAIQTTGVGVDVYIKGLSNLSTPDEDYIRLSNESFSVSTTNPNVSNASKIPLTTSYVLVGDDLPTSSYVYFKFFLSIPASQPAGTYNNSVSIKGVPHGTNP